METLHLPPRAEPKCRSKALERRARCPRPDPAWPLRLPGLHVTTASLWCCGRWCHPQDAGSPWGGAASLAPAASPGFSRTFRPSPSGWETRPAPGCGEQPPAPPLAPGPGHWASQQAWKPLPVLTVTDSTRRRGPSLPICWRWQDTDPPSPRCGRQAAALLPVRLADGRRLHTLCASVAPGRQGSLGLKGPAWSSGECGLTCC